MNCNSECPTVPPLYTWDSGTVPNKRDSHWDSRGTVSLKSLALAILSVPLERGKVGQSAGQSKNIVPQAGGRLGQKTAGAFPHGEEKLSLEKYDSADAPGSVNVADATHTNPSGIRDRVGAAETVIKI